MPNPFYTYILDIYDLVWFGLVLWRINNFLYTYILNIYDLQTHFFITFFNELKLLFFCTRQNDFKYFYLIQIIIFTINYVYTQLNGFDCCYLTLIILFSINRLFSDNKVFNPYSNQHYSFIFTESDASEYCYLISIIQLGHTVNEF